jgi:hypothetical protein
MHAETRSSFITSPAHGSDAGSRDPSIHTQRPNTSVTRMLASSHETPGVRRDPNEPHEERDPAEGYPDLADDPALNEDAAREAQETPGMGS